MVKLLGNILPIFIHNNQTGFTRQYQTQDNIQRTLHNMDYVHKIKLEAMVINVDVEKVFDLVNNMTGLIKQYRRYMIIPQPVLGV